MIDLFDEILADSVLTFTTFRVGMLYLWNLGCIQRNTVKNYFKQARVKDQIALILQENEEHLSYEISNELGTAFKHFYTESDVYNLLP